MVRAWTQIVQGVWVLGVPMWTEGGMGCECRCGEHERCNPWCRHGHRQSVGHSGWSEGKGEWHLHVLGHRAPQNMWVWGRNLPVRAAPIAGVLPCHPSIWKGRVQCTCVPGYPTCACVGGSLCVCVMYNNSTLVFYLTAMQSTGTYPSIQHWLCQSICHAMYDWIWFLHSFHNWLWNNCLCMPVLRQLVFLGWMSLYLWLHEFGGYQHPFASALQQAVSGEHHSSYLLWYHSLQLHSIHGTVCLPFTCPLPNL